MRNFRFNIRGLTATLSGEVRPLASLRTFAWAPIRKMGVINDGVS